ncbi:hypothetical protein BC941DRAFT_499482 [Chlamydoabsidia padenii]|nr:hypothetical protein BC941DRAFT_499482 [Chlamydoabsidia padenii]
MTLTVVKTKRKISCLVCRLKKIKCDGKKPCERCVKKNSSEQCMYSNKQQPLGRPPKNAVVNKLILSRTKNQHSTDNMYKEFIIENLVYTIPSGAKFLHNDKTKNLHYFMEAYFTDSISTAITQMAIVRVDGTFYISSLDIKIFDLLETHCWTTAELTNTFISKTSTVPLNSALEYNSIASAMFQEMTLKYFGEKSATTVINPLTTLTTPQAVRMIECFFCIHPYANILNKTLLLQAFWTDSIDPLLLCVIYGTTSYYSKLLEGKPVGLWDATTMDRRNPFLEYAYFLLQKSSSEATLVKYQAVILLGMFECRHGLPRRGMVLNGLALMISAKLGVLDGSLLSTEISDVESELLSCAYWIHFNSIVRGCIDVGHAPHYTTDITHPPPLPPVNIDKSLSYQLEKSNNDQRLFRSYNFLVESFYVSCVVSKYINKLLLLFPEVKYNLTYVGYQTGFRQKVGYPKAEGLVTGLSTVLLEFGMFIQENQQTWSTQQRYTINTVWMLLDVHLIFIMDHQPPPEGLNYTNSIFDIFIPTTLSIKDPKSMARIQLATPKIFNMIDTMETFLSESTNNQPTLLPRLLIVSVLETAISVLCLHHQSDQINNNTIWGYLNRVSKLTRSNMWSDWTAIIPVRGKIDNYLDQSAKKSAGSLPSPPSFNMEDNMTLAAFFDPSSGWLAPMVKNLPLDMMLWNNATCDDLITSTQSDPSLLFPLSDNTLVMVDTSSYSLTNQVNNNNEEVEICDNEPSTCSANYSYPDEMTSLGTDTFSSESSLPAFVN